MQAENLNLFTDTLQSFLENNTITFAASKGITPQNTAIPNFDLSDSLWPNINSFSPTAQIILSDLESLVDNYTESNHASFVSQCNSLKSEALNLSNENETVCVGFTVSVAINSFNYWKDNLAAWQTYLTYVPDDTLMVSRQAACNVNLRHVGGADVVGALRGGAAGIEGGPALMIASGLVVSGASSTFNILGQAATCLPGAVGTFSRWVASWF